eukprot:TRINITY_DN3149_c0_g2_i1.p1 TRINITY_DN3149_c0_g2~~TRINITY_DN3149_c0_g2_i1.p1  ORF type:complete len:406 (+),score=187.55 TRINITY_DN3149_c0_g2_i1:126-1220(+)
MFEDFEVTELNNGNCKSYAIAHKKEKVAALIDPLRENVAIYLGFLNYHHYRLSYVIDTHTHADHHSALAQLSRLTGATTAASYRAPSPATQLHLKDKDIIHISPSLKLNVLETPGHTPDCLSFYTGFHVFTGDALLIGGSGRTDFAGGDPAQSYDSIQNKLFTLPDETIVYPGHDYRGNSSSTIGHEKKTNARVGNGKTKEEYIQIMNNLGLPLPEKIMEALQVNMVASYDIKFNLPTYSQLTSVLQTSIDEVANIVKNVTKIESHLSNDQKSIVILDVRESSEYNSNEFSHIPTSISMPLNKIVELSKQLNKNQQIICVCRAGVRSTTAAAVLIGLGFENVKNMTGGMIDWAPKYGIISNNPI